MQQSSSVSPLTLGAKLRQAREQQGLRVDEVAATLKLLPRIIVHLESDNYQALPQTVFVKGYLRLYAELLALPINEVYAEFEAHYQQPMLAIKAPVVLDNVLPELENHQPNNISNWHYKVNPKFSRSWLGYGLALVLLVAMIVGVWQSRHFTKAHVAVDSVALPSQQQGIISLPNVTATRTVADILKLQFSADTKVLIKDANGTELANNIQKSGNILMVQGQAPFAIELNPAHGVLFTFNDKAIDLKPYIVNDVVNFRLSR